MKVLKIALTFTILSSTVAFGAVLKGFSENFSNGSVGSENTTCNTWDECIGNNIGSNTENTNTEDTNTMGTGTTPDSNTTYTLYYLDSPVNGLEEHPDLNSHLRFPGPLSFINGLQVIKELERNNINDKIPILGYDILSERYIAYYKNDYKNDEGTLALKKNSSSSGFRYFYSKLSQSGRNFYFNACQYDLDDNLNYIGSYCFKINYFYDSSYMYNTASKNKPVRVYNLNLLDSNFSADDILVIDSIYVEGYGSRNKTFLCLSNIKKNSTGVFENIVNCKHLSNGEFYLLDVFYKGNNLFIYSSDGSQLKKTLINCSNGICTSGITSNVPINNSSSGSIIGFLSYELIKDAIDKHSFCINGKCYSIDPATGSVSEDYIFPLLSTLGHSENNSTISQPSTPVDGVCEYEINYLGYTFVLKSKLYDENLNKCYTLSYIKRQPDSEIKVGDRIYYALGLRFNEVLGDIYAIGYSTMENGVSVYQIEGWSTNNYPMQAGLKFLFYSPIDQNYYVLLGGNLVLKIGRPNVSEFPYEAYIR